MITARGKSAVSVLDLRLQGGDHNRSMGLIIVRGWGCSSGLHPSQASRFIVDCVTGGGVYVKRHIELSGPVAGFSCDGPHSVALPQVASIQRRKIRLHPFIEKGAP